jgi:hypothetical protein
VPVDLNNVGVENHKTMNAYEERNHWQLPQTWRVARLQFLYQVRGQVRPLSALIAGRGLLKSAFLSAPLMHNLAFLDVSGTASSCQKYLFISMPVIRSQCWSTPASYVAKRQRACERLSSVSRRTRETCKREDLRPAFTKCVASSQSKDFRASCRCSR